MSYGLAKARYTSDAAETVPPARLLTMLYDRLVSDLLLAEEAMQRGDPQATGQRLGSAQAILLELHASLDVTAWSGGEALDQLYLWVIGELMLARMAGDPGKVAECRGLLEPLRDAWHEALSGPSGPAGAAATGTAGATTAAGAGGPIPVTAAR
jgi:flagellar secretion chaperone FliS